MRHVRVLGTAGILAGLLAATASGAAALDGTTFSVANDGSGDFDTIAAAIEAATGGDTIRIAPGTYAEMLVVEEDITLSGDGVRDEIVVSMPADGVALVTRPNQLPGAALHVIGADPFVEHVSFESPLGVGVPILIEGGAPSFDDVSVAGAELLLLGGEPVFSDSLIDAYFAVREGASPTVERSEFLGHASVDGPGHTIIRDSVLHAGTSASADATGAYEGNHFIGVQLAVDTGSDMLVQDNLVEGVRREAAIVVRDAGSSAQIIGNTVRDSDIGISVDSDEPGTHVEGNQISGVRFGIHVDSDAIVNVLENTIEDARTAGFVLQGDGAAVAHNKICGEGVAFDIRDGSPDILTNDICAALEP